MTTPTIQQLLTRASMPKLIEPGPSAEELQQILHAGLLAPDHAYLRPTRLSIVSGDGLQRLGDLFAQAAMAEDTEATAEQLEKIRLKPLRAPLIIVAGCRVKTHHKVPEIEQVGSTAAAVSLMQVAIDALGYGSMWRTGGMAYSGIVKRAFGLSSQDHLMGFLYVGTPVKEPKKRADVLWDERVSTF
ncbi:MAG: nitroreductase family protein [Natronospirillum sp.]